MQLIQKVSQNFVRLFNVMLVGVPAADILYWVLESNPRMSYSVLQSLEQPNPVIDVKDIQWTAFTKSIGCSGNLIASIPFILGLLILRLLFKNYQSGKIFTSENVRFYKQLGYLCFVNALITTPISDMVTTLAATLTNPSGEHLIVLGWGTTNLTSLFYGFLVIVISWVMNEGHKLEVEHQYTI